MAGALLVQLAAGARRGTAAVSSLVRACEAEFVPPRRELAGSPAGSSIQSARQEGRARRRPLVRLAAELRQRAARTPCS